MRFIGQASDAAVAKYLYVKLSDEFYEAAGKAARAEGYKGKMVTNYRISFVMAAADVIQNRLAQTKRELRGESEKFGALVVLKDQLVNDYISKNFPRLKSGRYSIGDNGTGSAAGRAAGQNADLRFNKIHGSSGSGPARLT